MFKNRLLNFHDGAAMWCGRPARSREMGNGRGRPFYNNGRCEDLHVDAQRLFTYPVRLQMLGFSSV
jgi:hypothetical protein